MIERRGRFYNGLAEDPFRDADKDEFFDVELDERGDLLRLQELFFSLLEEADGYGDCSGGDGISIGPTFWTSYSVWTAS